MSNQSIAIRDNGKTKLAPFGSSAEVREMGKRLLATIRVKLTGGNSRGLTPPEAGMMASACIMHGLDPYTGDLYPMQDKDGNFSIVPGKTAWTKAANRALEKQGGGNFWFDERLIGNPEERLLLMLPLGAIAYEVRLYDTPTIRAYSETITAMQAAGATWPEIKDAVGNRPCVIGLGIYSPGGNTAGQDAKYPPHERAKKRGRCAALKAKYNLPFDDYGEGADDLPDDYRSKSTATITVDNAPESHVATDEYNTERHAANKAAIDGDEYKPSDAAIDAGLAAMKDKEKAQRARDKAALYPE